MKDLDIALACAASLVVTSYSRSNFHLSSKPSETAYERGLRTKIIRRRHGGWQRDVYKDLQTENRLAYLSR